MDVVVQLVELMFAVAIAGVLIWACWRLLMMAPMLEPFRVVIIAIFTVICLIILWQVVLPLLELGGHLHLARHHD